jgi:hypothetical protein
MALLTDLLEAEVEAGMPQFLQFGCLPASKCKDTTTRGLKFTPQFPPPIGQKEGTREPQGKDEPRKGNFSCPLCDFLKSWEFRARRGFMVGKEKDDCGPSPHVTEARVGKTLDKRLGNPGLLTQTAN